jgi:hypothetical protein
MKRVYGLLSMAALVFTVACGQTDAGITTSVKSALAADDTVKAYQIDVDTNGGVVTLTGAVDSAAAKRQAVLVAREADGVSDVVDNLVIDEAVATSGADIDDRTESEIREGAGTVSGTAERAGESAEEAARRAADAARRGAEATADGAREAGREVRDAVTPD